MPLAHPEITLASVRTLHGLSKGQDRNHTEKRS